MTEHIIDYIPFVKHKSDGDYLLSTSRIIEALIIAMITGAISVYSTQKVLEVRLESLSNQVQRIERSVDEVKNDVYRHRLAEDRR